MSCRKGKTLLPRGSDCNLQGQIGGGGGPQSIDGQGAIGVGSGKGGDPGLLQGHQLGGGGMQSHQRTSGQSGQSGGLGIGFLGTPPGSGKDDAPQSNGSFAGIAFRPLGAGFPGFPFRPLRAGLTGVPFWPLRAGFTSVALRSLRAGLTGVPFWPLRAGLTSVALRSLRTGLTSVALRPLRAGLTSVALWSLRAGFTSVALRSLRAGLTGFPFRSLRAGFAGIALRPLGAGFAGSAVLAVFSVLTVGAVFAIPAVKQPGIGIGPEGICRRNGGLRLGKQALDEGGGGFSGGIFLRCIWAPAGS